MIQDEIVNRTPETWGLRQEQSRLEADSDGNVETGLKSFGDTIQESVTDLKAPENAVTSNFPVTVESAWADQVGKVELQDPSFEAGQAVIETLARTLLARTPRDPDLKVFRQQVIQAFKHLGLDTNKFFGQ